MLHGVRKVHKIRYHKSRTRVRVIYIYKWSYRQNSELKTR